MRSFPPTADPDLGKKKRKARRVAGLSHWCHILFSCKGRALELLMCDWNLFCGVQDKCSSAKGDDGSILYSNTIFGSKNFVHEEGSCDAVIIA